MGLSESFLRNRETFFICGLFNALVKILLYLPKWVILKIILKEKEN